MKKALVFYSYSSNNAGDMAICLGTIAFLKKNGFSVEMVSRFHNAAPEYEESKSFIQGYYPDVKIYPGVFKLDRSSGFLSQAGQYAAGFVKSLLSIDDKRMKKLILDSDVVFFNGGNLLRCNGLVDYARLRALFYPIKTARRLGKRIVCLPQSTAKSEGIWGSVLHKELLLFDKVFIRESVSCTKLSERYPDIPFVLGTDMAFFMDDMEGCKRIQNDKTTVALVVRGTGIGDIGQLPDSRRSEMMAALESLCKENKDMRFLVVVQTKKDRSLSDELVSRLSSFVECSLIEEHDAFKLLSLYKTADITVTMRLHAGILSLRSGTPVVGFFDEEWGLKNVGIMSDYGMGCGTTAEELKNEFSRILTSHSADGLVGIIERYEKDASQEIR